MIIVTNFAFASELKRERLMMDLSTVRIMVFANQIHMVPIEAEDKDSIIQAYETCERADEVFDEILKAAEDGKVVYRIPLE